MPGGPLQERLRDWVRDRLKRRRGSNMALSRHLKKEPSWVTLYTAGVRDADLDVAVQIAQFFGVSLTAIIGEAPLPPGVAPDAELEAKARAFERIQELIERMPLPPTSERSQSAAPETTRERAAEDQTNTAKARNRRIVPRRTHK